MKTSLAIKAFEDFTSITEIDDCLKDVAAWGYDAVEPMICDPSLIDHAGILALLESHGLLVSGFRTGLIFQREGWSLTDPDEAVRDRAVNRLNACADVAAFFPGAGLVNGLIQGPLQRAKLSEEQVTIEQADAWIVECLKVCCAKSERLGAPFCLEAVNRYELPYHNTLDEVSKIIDRVGSPWLKILIDTFHMNIEEVDPADAVRQCGPYIGAVHMADSNRLAPGLGHIDFSEIIRALLEVDYDGFLTMEIMHPHIRDAGEAGASKYIQELLHATRA